MRGRPPVTKKQNAMIFIVKKSEGDYEDYYEKIVAVYNIRGNAINIPRKHLEYLCDLYNKKYPNRYSVETSNYPSGEDPCYIKVSGNKNRIKGETMATAKINSDWPIDRFIEEVLGYKPIKYVEKFVI